MAPKERRIKIVIMVTSLKPMEKRTVGWAFWFFGFLGASAFRPPAASRFPARGVRRRRPPLGGFETAFAIEFHSNQAKNPRRGQFYPLSNHILFESARYFTHRAQKPVLYAPGASPQDPHAGLSRKHSCPVSARTLPRRYPRTLSLSKRPALERSPRNGHFDCFDKLSNRLNDRPPGGPPRGDAAP